MKKLKLWLASFSFLAIILVPSVASADVNDFVIKSFDSEQTLSRDDPQGSLRIVENIRLVYSDYNHGILRAIPQRYKNHDLQLKVNRINSTTGAPVQYTTYSSNGNTVLKIGDPSRTITGPQQYTIDYTVNNVITFYDDHDELYWDVNGDQWQQTFENVSVKIHLPEGLVESSNPECFAGSFGRNDIACNLLPTGEAIILSSASELGPNQTMTYVLGFKKGYFTPSTWYETAAEYKRPIIGVLLPIFVIGGSSFVFWWRFGRDPKGKGTVIPQYDTPGNLKPLMVGALIDFKVDNRDITAALIDLAVRGYIKIIESKKDRLIRKDKLDYSLELKNEDTSGLDADEQLLLKSIFTTFKAGQKVELSKSKNKLYTAASTLRSEVSKRLKEEGYLADSPIKGGKIGSVVKLLALLVLIMTVGFVVAGGWLALGIGLAVAFSIPFWVAMSARTLAGVEAKEHILGLKTYLETAEKDRMTKLQSPNAEYAAGASEPVKTVELFEKLLPYAVVLQVEKEWAKQFESLYTTPPDWYSGNWSTFNSYYLASSLSGGIGSAVNTSFSAPSSSGSSGSSGGSSGGGGGGGGGGGW